MDEFLNLEAKEVERWISSDEISVTVEADVLKIVLKWIEQNKSERKASFEELFRHVRLGFLSRDFLFDVVTNELVRENIGCFKLISDAVKLTSFSCEADLSQSPRKGLETRAIVACGGKFTFCYLPEKDGWKRLADGLTGKNTGTPMISYCNELYSFPCGRKAERYDPVVNGWCTLDLSTTWSTKVAVVRGEIFSIDINTSSRKSTVKRYDVERCSWETVLSSHEGCREDSCVVATGNHLYVCGGKLGGEDFSKAERFDTVENKWEEIANMQQKRGNAFGVATDGKIFVAGGRQVTGPARWLGQVYGMYQSILYNIFTNEWQFIGSLTVNHEYGSMRVCLNGTIYVLGGSNASGLSRLSVECYDPTEDKWIEKTTIPVKMVSKGNKVTFTGCVLKLSKGVLDKLDIVEGSES